MKCPQSIAQGKETYHQQWEDGEQRWSIDKEYVKWEWFWKPRTCSYCGCIHVEDVIKLLKEGWEISNTDKPYKYYIEPPGYHFVHASFHAAQKKRREEGIPAQGDIEGFEKNSKLLEQTWSAVPPVKLYTWHITEVQADEINKIIKVSPPPENDTSVRH